MIGNTTETQSTQRLHRESQTVLTRPLGIRLAASCVIGLVLSLMPNLVHTTEASSPSGETQRRVQPRTQYSDFSHTTHVNEEKLACGSCHKFPTGNWKELRKGDAAFRDVTEYPEHKTCL